MSISRSLFIATLTIATIVGSHQLSAMKRRGGELEHPAQRQRIGLCANDFSGPAWGAFERALCALPPDHEEIYNALPALFNQGLEFGRFAVQRIPKNMLHDHILPRFFRNGFDDVQTQTQVIEMLQSLGIDRLSIAHAISLANRWQTIVAMKNAADAAAGQW